MRPGWHADWDATERRVWTSWCVVWLCVLSALLIGLVLSKVGLPDVPDVMSVLVWTVVPFLLLLHLFTYALMWLRRMIVG